MRIECTDSSTFIECSYKNIKEIKTLDGPLFKSIITFKTWVPLNFGDGGASYKSDSWASKETPEEIQKKIHNEEFNDSFEKHLTSDDD